MTRQEERELIQTITEMYCEDALRGFVSKRPVGGTEVYDYMFTPSTDDGLTILQVACRDLGLDIDEVLPRMITIAMEVEQAIVDYFHGLEEAL